MKKELLKGLSEEQIKKVKACKNTDELLEVAKEEGIELTDEQLEAVSGGACSGPAKCPKCGSDETTRTLDCAQWHYKCYVCHYTWTIDLY